MSEEFAISLSNVSKSYKIYNAKYLGILDALGMGSLLPKHSYSVFTALQDINLRLPKGKRVGIIGRNGAGKSTLLKIISGYLTPTNGIVKVNGKVQSLMDGGAGFHPEFTGYENILASLTYQGLTGNKLHDAIEEIRDFTELGDFLYRPFKTYSLGMQARLTFATATAKKPDILIVDEVLGAGDAYFQQKSAARIKRIVEDSGASVLIVSHALDQISRYCEQCIWLDQGKIIQSGLTRDVITNYEVFINNLTNERLKTSNSQREMVVSSKTRDITPNRLFNTDLVETMNARGILPIIRWPSKGELKMSKFFLQNQEGNESYVFKFGDTLFAKLEITSNETKTLNLVLGLTLTRLDGISVCNFVNEPIHVLFKNGEIKQFTLKLPSLILNNGDYIFTPSIFEDIVSAETRLDLLARVCEFNIIGSPSITNGFIVTHPFIWESM